MHLLTAAPYDMSLNDSFVQIHSIRTHQICLLQYFSFSPRFIFFSFPVTDR